MRVIVGVCGKQFRGKTTVAQFLEVALDGFKINPLATPVKQEYAELLGISLVEVEERKRRDSSIRAGLQALGHAKREQEPRYWIDKCLEYKGDMIVDDIRYLNEIEAFVEAADIFYLIKIECPREVVVEQKRGKLSNEDHVTETQLDSYDNYSMLMSNDDSLEQLEQQAYWAAHDVWFSIQHFSGMAQRNIMDHYLGVGDADEDEDV